MDLQTAKKEIVAKSRKDPKAMFFLNVDDEGEVSVSKQFVLNSSGFCYRNGSEIALPERSETPEPKTKGSKQTVATETANKMATKKAASKKSSAKPAAKAAADWGKKAEVSIKDMRARLKKGEVFRNLQGVLLTETILKEKARQEHVRPVYVSKA